MQKPICIVLFLLAVHFTSGQSKKGEDIAAIKAARASSNASIAKHDIKGISRYWLDDFVQVRGNAGHLTGRDTIAASWQQLFTMNPEVSYIRSPSQIIISANDTLAWETGIWKAIHSYSKGGKYSAMWRKKEGEWKIQAELFVSLY